MPVSSSATDEEEGLDGGNGRCKLRLHQQRGEGVGGLCGVVGSDGGVSCANHHIGRAKPPTTCKEFPAPAAPASSPYLY